MKVFRTVFFLIMIAFCVTSCYTFEHTVGTGAQTGVEVEKKQWFALWGLVPITNVDSKEMAGGAENYTITTTHSFVDQVIGLFTGFVTIYPTTVKVTK